MNKNEIKKALYKQKPFASLVDVRKDGIYYDSAAHVYDSESDLYEPTKLSFLVPFNEIGETIFKREMPAELLIRYLVNEIS